MIAMVTRHWLMTQNGSEMFTALRGNDYLFSDQICAIFGRLVNRDVTAHIQSGTGNYFRLVFRGDFSYERVETAEVMYLTDHITQEIYHVKLQCLTAYVIVIRFGSCTCSCTSSSCRHTGHKPLNSYRITASMMLQKTLVWEVREERKNVGGINSNSVRSGESEIKH